MGGSGDWGMPRSSASPVGSMMRPGLEYNNSNSKAMMSGPMVGRSTSVPGISSTLQPRLMDMGTSGRLSPGVSAVGETQKDTLTPHRLSYLVCVCVSCVYYTPRVLQTVC